ncbi:MAG: hypothetical protein QXL09_02055 [Candidatus Aenigmatarchaeota archaeon]
MPYILDPLFVARPGGGIIGTTPWDKYINPWPGARAKWLGKALLIQPLDQYIILNPTMPIGSFQNLYYGTIGFLTNSEFLVKKVDEWIEVSPVHKAYYDLVLGEKERIEIKIKTVLDDMIKHISDLELLEHDLRRYKEFLDYIEKNDEHSLKAIFIDQVDFHAGEGAPGRLSMSFMQQQNIFPTIIQDFYEMESEEDLEKKDRLKGLPKVEKDMLLTKWRSYQEWKSLFGSEVKRRYERLKELIDSKRAMIEQTREWIKPYIARHKLLEEGLSRSSARKEAISSLWHVVGEQTSEEVITLWAWKQFEVEEFFKAPGEILALRNVRPDDEWTKEHLIFHEELGLKQKYPWITEKWVENAIKEIMEKDDLMITRRRVEKRYLYYGFLEIIFDKRTLRTPQGKEIEDIDIIVRCYLMSQNVLLVKLLELKAKEEEFERYINKLLGLESKLELERLRKELTGMKKEEKIRYLSRNFSKLTEQEIKAKLEAIGEHVDIEEVKRYMVKKKKKFYEPLLKAWEKFSDFFGLDFRFMKKGPYEKDFENRITKFYLVGTGRYIYGPLVGFLKSKIMV